MPRILHTADWHLGHRLYDRNRTDEHRAALRWLLELIRVEAIDVVIVAGDVFDKANPSNQAQELYYEFLAGLIHSDCQAAVVVGGNHDSPSMLDAPRGIARASNLHIVGAAREEIGEQVIEIELKNEREPNAVIVAAVPYLHERDIRTASYGESGDDRITAIQRGILEHYRGIAAIATARRKDPTTPMIVTGHLFASGATDEEDKKSHIYQADEDNIEAGRFPKCFDYVALGHVHRAQSIDGQDHVRYSGSLVPLTFVEGQQPRSVTVVELGPAGQRVKTRKIKVPYFRTLLRLRGDLDTVLDRLRAEVAIYVTDCATREEPAPRPWVEAKISAAEPIPNLKDRLLEAISEAEPEEWADRTLEIRRFNTVRAALDSTLAPAATPVERLDEIDPAEVFSGICERGGVSPESTRELLEDFAELRSWAQENAGA